MKDFEQNLKRINEKLAEILREVEKIIVGQREVIKQILIAILCDGNALLEGNPGLGKTTLAKSIAQTMEMKFSRIQGTPDLMPSDVTGTYIIDEDSSGRKIFKFQKGPIFANLILFDEINRATPRTQSALLEAMQERQVTVGNKTFELERPFFVLATQNPIDLEGVFPLPEAQTDRFLLKINVPYPNSEEEFRIIERFGSKIQKPEVKKVIGNASLVFIQNIVKEVPIASDLKKRIIEIVSRTRNHKYIRFGASPRASIALTLASKANALLNGRTYVSEKDVAEMLFPVLRHRIILNFEAEKEDLKPDDVLKMVLDEK